MKFFSSCFLALIFIFAGCESNVNQDVESEGEQSFFQKISLYERDTNGKERATGLVVERDWDSSIFSEVRIIVSPNEDKVLFNLWEDSHMVLYVSNINGTERLKVAEQASSEGNGELDIWSLKWVDNQHIQYEERSLICPQLRCNNPGDFVSEDRMYNVNINSLEKKAV